MTRTADAQIETAALTYAEFKAVIKTVPGTPTLTRAIDGMYTREFLRGYFRDEPKGDLGTALLIANSGARLAKRLNDRQLKNLADRHGIEAYWMEAPIAN